MIRLAMTILPGASLLCAAKEKTLVSGRAITYLILVNERTSTYTILGSSNTNCSGIGTTLGNTTTASAGRQTYSTPAQSQQITSRSVDVINVVELNGMQYTISCRASWVGSNCAPMIDRDVFPAEGDGNTIWIIGRRAATRGSKLGRSTASWIFAQ